jgi:poly-gamma-glutamate capsule biosynthesis protein CapA/YwtB (metallophosphatase superfamily)
MLVPVLDQRRRGVGSLAGILAAVGLSLCACTSVHAGRSVSPTTGTTGGQLGTSAASSKPARPPATTSASPARSEEFTVAFAGDVHFMERTATRLTNDPATVFGQAASVLASADLTIVNLETAITTRGDPAPKDFHFRAPPSAFTALREAGIDVATMANNHAADYGTTGLHDTLAAIRSSRFPVVGIGADAAAAFAPWVRTVRGTRVAIIAASQVRDETLANYAAGPDSPGVASADSDRLLEAVRAARAAGDVVIVYLHWGIEFDSCPTGDQRSLADALTRAGASAIVGAHVHVLQGSGWRPDGRYVAYGLGNYLWWRSFGNAQDDNGVLTLTFRRSRVVAARFHPAHLDDRGVPVPATGAQAARINVAWQQARLCADLAATPPR